MTRHIHLRHLLAAAVAILVLAPTAAVATHIFDDVEDGRFFADPVEWAAENEITTGTTETTFEPDRGVTRGESVTFLKRYDDNIVQPALTDLSATLEDAIAALPTIYWARVFADSTVQEGTEGISVESAGLGLYDVTFPGSVADCGIQVTLHTRADTAGLEFVFLEYAQEAYATVMDNSETSDDDTVRVTTYFQNQAASPTFATPTDLGFSIMTTC